MNPQYSNYALECKLNSVFDELQKYEGNIFTGCIYYIIIVINIETTPSAIHNFTNKRALRIP